MRPKASKNGEEDYSTIKVLVLIDITLRDDIQELANANNKHQSSGEHRLPRIYYNRVIDYTHYEHKRA